MAAGQESHATNAVPIIKNAIYITATVASSIGEEKKFAAQLNFITIPTVPAVIVYFYRQRKDEPLHALSVELWVGQQKKAVRERVHTLGAHGSQCTGIY